MKTAVQEKKWRTGGVALVGYTNVGKSSLLNALTGSDAGVADMLFATLGPHRPQAGAARWAGGYCGDTVGFCQPPAPQPGRCF